MTLLLFFASEPESSEDSSEFWSIQKSILDHQLLVCSHEKFLLAVHQQGTLKTSEWVSTKRFHFFWNDWYLSSENFQTYMAACTYQVCYHVFLIHPLHNGRWTVQKGNTKMMLTNSHISLSWSHRRLSHLPYRFIPMSSAQQTSLRLLLIFRFYLHMHNCVTFPYLWTATLMCTIWPLSTCASRRTLFSTARTNYVNLRLISLDTFARSCKSWWYSPARWVTDWRFSCNADVSTHMKSELLSSAIHSHALGRIH